MQILGQVVTNSITRLKRWDFNIYVIKSKFSKSSYATVILIVTCILFREWNNNENRNYCELFYVFSSFNSIYTVVSITTNLSTFFANIERISQVHVTKEYLQLEPIGLVFVFFFALILVIQFTAMLFHRFGTFAHILASTSLDWYCCKKVSIFWNRWSMKFSRD